MKKRAVQRASLFGVMVVVAFIGMVLVDAGNAMAVTVDCSRAAVVLDTPATNVGYVEVNTPPRSDIGQFIYNQTLFLNGTPIGTVTGRYLRIDNGGLSYYTYDHTIFVPAFGTLFGKGSDIEAASAGQGGIAGVITSIVGANGKKVNDFPNLTYGIPADSKKICFFVE
jgi:hypothetical protein